MLKNSEDVIFKLILQIDIRAAILQTTFSNAFSCMKMFRFRLKFHCILFFRIDHTSALIQIIIMAWWWTGGKPLAEPMMAYFIDVYIYASLGLNELILFPFLMCSAGEKHFRWLGPNFLQEISQISIEYIKCIRKCLMSHESFVHILDVVNYFQEISFSWKTRTLMSCIINTMAADDLATQGARASAVMILT